MSEENYGRLMVREIAERINAHLRRCEADPKINTKTRERTSRYWNSGAGASGRFVRIVYVRYQGSVAVPKADAICYLRWLDAGNEGQHYRALAAADPHQGERET